MLRTKTNLFPCPPGTRYSPLFRCGEYVTPVARERHKPIKIQRGGCPRNYADETMCILSRKKNKQRQAKLQNPPTKGNVVVNNKCGPKKKRDRIFDIND